MGLAVDASRNLPQAFPQQHEIAVMPVPVRIVGAAFRDVVLGSVSALLLLCCGMPALAATVFKCTTASGQVVYQDAPCSNHQRQQTLDLPDRPAAPPARPTAGNAASVAPPQTDVVPASPPPRVAPEPMYGCVRATDGKPYTSSTGAPPAYLAPLGMLDAADQSLSQAYGPTHGGAGISAPEANRGRVTSDLVANNFVWVQDPCRPLSEAETCQLLRDAQEQNAHKLQHAFKSDRPPLQRRDDELRAQLQGC